MEFYGDATQKHRSSTSQVGVIREKYSKKVATFHWESETIRKFHNNICEVEAYAARLANEECIYWQTKMAEVSLTYRFERFTVLCHSARLAQRNLPAT